MKLSNLIPPVTVSHYKFQELWETPTAKTGRALEPTEISWIYAFSPLILHLVQVLGADNIKFVMAIASKIMYLPG